MIGAFQKTAFQDNAFQVGTAVGGDDGPTGGIWWRPEKEYKWPDLAGDVLSSVYAAVRELAEEEEQAPTVAAVVARVQPMAFAMPPQIDLEAFAEQLRSAIAEAITAWQAQEDEEAVAMLMLH